jgi:hypothetical protein
VSTLVKTPYFCSGIAMKINRFKVWLMTITTAGLLLQSPTCTETANTVTAIATTVTAGAAVFLANEILN